MTISPERMTYQLEPQLPRVIVFRLSAPELSAPSLSVKGYNVTNDAKALT